MPTESGYVRFWIENGVEVAMCTAQDFRDAMNERDQLRAEKRRLRAALKEIADGVHPLEMVRVAQTALAPQPRP